MAMREQLRPLIEKLIGMTEANVLKWKLGDDDHSFCFYRSAGSIRVRSVANPHDATGWLAWVEVLDADGHTVAAFREDPRDPSELDGLARELVLRASNSGRGVDKILEAWMRELDDVAAIEEPF